MSTVQLTTTIASRPSRAAFTARRAAYAPSVPVRSVSVASSAGRESGAPGDSSGTWLPKLTKKKPGAVEAWKPPALTLTYFNIQGVGEKVRLALALGGIPFEDERVAPGDWPALKPNTPYGQLPILTIAGGLPMGQSDAMLRYVGRLASDHNGVPLYPRGSELEIDEAMGLVADLAADWSVPVGVGIVPTKYGYSDTFKGSDEHAEVVRAVRERWMKEKFPVFMRYVAGRVGSDGCIVRQSSLVAATPTIADCALIPILTRLACGAVDHVPADCMAPFPEVTAYMERFNALPAVASYYQQLGGSTKPAPAESK